MLRGQTTTLTSTHLALGVEVANLPPTQVTKLGCFFLTLGLQALAGEGEGKVISKKFAQQIENMLEPSFFEKYGIKSSYIKTYDRVAINQGFVKELKTKAKKIVNDPAISTNEIQLMKFAILFMENPTKNPNYLDRAKKHAMSVSAAYYRNFQKVVDRISASTSGNKLNINALHDELADVVAEILVKKPKKDALYVDNPVIQKFRTGTNRQVELARRYRKIRLDIGLAYDMDVGSFLAVQKDNIAYVHEVYEHMEKLGYRLQKLPHVTKKIPLKLGLQLGKPKFYTDDGKPLNAAIPSTAKDIKFTKTYKDDGTGAYLTYTSDMAAGITRVYTEIHMAKSAQKISDATTSISSKIDKVVANWKRDLTSTDPIKMMAATSAVMIYLTAMRVGARQSSAASQTGVPTYGAISLRPRHIVLKSNAIYIKYKGKSSAKSGVEQKHIIRVTSGDPLTKRLFNNLGKLLEGKKGDQLVFSMSGARGKKDVILSYSKFNEYLKASGYPAGIHKMRRVRGTNLMLDLLKSNKWIASKKAVGNLTKSQKEGETFVIDKILIPIANLLGHKSGTGADLWRTTAKSYIEPEPLIKWFNDKSLRVPKWLPKKASSE